MTQTKKGHLPSVDLSQPRKQTGFLPSVHPIHDNVGYTFHDDGSASADINDPQMVQNIREGRKTSFRLVMTPKMLHVLGRFLCKVGIELICTTDRRRARSAALARARHYARFGEVEGLWPIFQFSTGRLADLKHSKQEGNEAVEEVLCYSYAVLDFGNRYLLFRFTIGTDNWVICLNDPYPHPEIRNAFPDCHLNLVWYSKGQLGDRKESSR